MQKSYIDGAEIYKKKLLILAVWSKWPKSDGFGQFLGSKVSHPKGCPSIKWQSKIKKAENYKYGGVYLPSRINYLHYLAARSESEILSKFFDPAPASWI